MEINLIIEEIEKSADTLLINIVKRRRKGIKKRNFLLEELFKRRQILKVKHFLLTIELYEDDVFFSHFRMSRDTLGKLVTALHPFWSMVGTKYTLKQSLYLTLWKLSNSRITYRQLSDRFNVGKGTAHKIFWKTMKAICCLRNEISWPTVAEQQDVMEKFQEKRPNSFPYVVGCVDGIHFEINTPKQDAVSYYDRKGHFSIIMQAICDSSMRFRDVFIGYPGSCHDANVWRNSPIYKKITTGEVQLASGAIILADSAYPIAKYLMVPYRDNGHLSAEERKFNYFLSSTRVLIEQSFGVLRKKFKILNHIDVSTAKKASKIVMACSILHNFIINHDGDPTASDILDMTNIHHDHAFEPVENINESNEGIVKRNELKMLFVS